MVESIRNCVSLFRRQKFSEYGRKLFGEAACLCDGFKLPVDILGIALFASSDSAYNDHPMPRINSVNDAVVSELVFPIICQRTAQPQPVSFWVNG